MSGRIHWVVLGGFMVLFAGCAKQGSVLSQVAGNAATSVSGGGVSAGSACSSASNPLVTYYSGLSSCTSVWGSGNCSLVIVAYNGANYSCYTKTVPVAGGTTSGSGSGSTTLSVTPSAAQSLGNVSVAALSGSTATYTVSNTSASVSATGCTYSLSNPSVFTVSSNNCGSTIAASGSCTIGVRGTPLSENTFTTNLNIGCSNSGTGISRQISVTGVVGSGGTTTSGSGSGSGSGVSSAPSLSVSPSTGTSLGLVTVYSESSAANFTFSNSGTASATGCTVGMSPVSVFILNSSCGTSLAAGASCSVSVTGIPASAVSYSTTLTFECTNGGPFNRSISLTGYSSGGTTTTTGGGGGTSSGCFIAGTRVEMADGSLKAIEEIRIGDRVRGTSGKVNSVTKLFKIPHRGLKYGFNGGKPFFTDSHPFLSDRGWRSLNPVLSSKESPGLAVLNMNPGDVLMTRDGSFRIHRIDSVMNSETVYNFTTDGDHSYIADGYKVHNVQNKPTTSGTTSGSGAGIGSSLN